MKEQAWYAPMSVGAFTTWWDDPARLEKNGKAASPAAQPLGKFGGASASKAAAVQPTGVSGGGGSTGGDIGGVMATLQGNGTVSASGL